MLNDSVEAALLLHKGNKKVVEIHSKQVGEFFKVI